MDAFQNNHIFILTMYKRHMKKHRKPEGYTKTLIEQKSPAKTMYVEEILVENSGYKTCS